jgi:hypothetical protein
VGSGKFNTVFEVGYKTRDDSFAFKPIKENAGKKDYGGVSKQIGIDRNNPQYAMRNLATCDIANKLKFNVVPQTEIGMSKPQGRKQPAQLGLVMSFAPGQPAAKTPPDVFRNAQVRAEITKLQLLDHLVGQGDRHGKNYFIEVGKDGTVVVTGIDNDQCLGKEPSDPNGIAYAKSKSQRAFRGTTLPPVVDTDMRDAFRDMTANDLETLLGGKFSAEEIQAAKDRLAGIKAHIADPNKCLVIAPGDWDKPNVTALLSSGNSYIGRDGGSATGNIKHDQRIDALNQFGLGNF